MLRLHIVSWNISGLKFNSSISYHKMKMSLVAISRGQSIMKMRASQPRVFMWNISSPSGTGLWLQWSLTHWGQDRNGRHFADSLFKHISLDESCCISIQISLRCVPMGPISNKPALVQIMAWCRIGDNPLFEPVMAKFMVSSLGHDEVTLWDNMTMYTAVML